MCVFFFVSSHSTHTHTQPGVIPWWLELEAQAQNKAAAKQSLPSATSLDNGGTVLGAGIETSCAGMVFHSFPGPEVRFDRVAETVSIRFVFWCVLRTD